MVEQTTMHPDLPPSHIALLRPLTEMFARTTNPAAFFQQALGALNGLLRSGDGLRASTADDLIPDANLISLFQVDYNHLAPAERRILRCRAYVESLDEASLLDQMEVSIPAIQLRYLVQSLAQLCYVRRVGDRYYTGNQLLRNWLQFWAVDEPPPLSNAAAVVEADAEQQLITPLTASKCRQRKPEEQKMLRGVNTPAEVLLELEDIAAAIARLEKDLERLPSQGIVAPERCAGSV